MSNILTSKFAGLLRGLLQRFDDNGANGIANPRPVAASAPLPATTTVKPVETASSTLASVATASVSENANELALPLQSVLATLPMELRAKIMQTPPAGATIVIPVEKVLTQLATGSVKISFGELRLTAPGMFVNSGGEFDSRPVTLPLNEILSRINPAMLARRAAQKQVEVADDITGPFDGHGRGITFTAAPLKPATQETPMPLSRLNQPVTSAPGKPPLAPPPVFFSRSVTPAPAPIANDSTPHNGNGNGNGHTNGNGNGHSNGYKNGNGNGHVNGNGAPPPVFSDRTAPPAIPSFHGAPPIPIVTDDQPILASVSALMESWPEALKLELVQSNAMNSEIALPVNLVEPLLKRGRVAFTWKFLRALLQPAPLPVSVHDGVELELPLKVVAPLFFARRKTPKFQQKISAVEEIPNLFFGFPQPAMTPVTAAPEPVAALPVVKPADQKIADTNFYVWGENGEVPKIDETEYKRSQAPATDFTSRHATPKEIVERAMVLPGVSGVVVSLPDGLRVASQVPADLNADTLAAFLPQIFDRLGQSTRELRMGALNNVSFTVGNIPWKVFRVNSVYFAAFGRAGEQMPTAQLAQLAAQLDRKNNN